MPSLDQIHLDQRIDEVKTDLAQHSHLVMEELQRVDEKFDSFVRENENQHAALLAELKEIKERLPA